MGNDLDESLMEVYKALRDRPDQFITACRDIEPMRPGEGSARLRAVFDRFVGDAAIDPALRYYFLNRTNWGGIPYRPHHAPCCSTPQKWGVVMGDRLWQAAGILRGVKLTAGDYLDLLRAPGENVWAYCDPPYYVNTVLPKGAQLYRHCFSEDQHALFSEHVKECRHKVVISYDDHEFIRSLYTDPRFTVTNTGAMRYQLNGKEVSELLITNYAPG